MRCEELEKERKELRLSLEEARERAERVLFRKGTRSTQNVYTAGRIKN